MPTVTTWGPFAEAVLGQKSQLPAVWAAFQCGTLSNLSSFNFDLDLSGDEFWTKFGALYAALHPDDVEKQPDVLLSWFTKNDPSWGLVSSIPGGEFADDFAFNPWNAIERAVNALYFLVHVSSTEVGQDALVNVASSWAKSVYSSDDMAGVKFNCNEPGAWTQYTHTDYWIWGEEWSFEGRVGMFYCYGWTVVERAAAVVHEGVHVDKTQHKCPFRPDSAFLNQADPYAVHGDPAWVFSDPEWAEGLPGPHYFFGFYYEWGSFTPLPCGLPFFAYPQAYQQEVSYIVSASFWGWLEGLVSADQLEIARVRANVILASAFWVDPGFRVDSWEVLDQLLET